MASKASTTGADLDQDISRYMTGSKLIIILISIIFHLNRFFTHPQKHLIDSPFKHFCNSRNFRSTNSKYVNWNTLYKWCPVSIQGYRGLYLQGVVITRGLVCLKKTYLKS